MSKASTLYDLQKLDLEIEAKEKELSQVMEKLGDDTILQEQRAALEVTKTQAADLEKRRQSLDWEAADLQAKITPHEKKLYSGQLKAPKELLALQQDVEMLKGHRRGLEDAELEIMLELDETNRQVRETSKELEEQERHWKEEQKRLSATKDTLSGEIAILQGQREAQARQIDPATLDTYQRIREKRQGLAVVTLDRGTCLGCRITVTSIEVQRARAGRELVFCQSCGRILYVN